MAKRTILFRTEHTRRTFVEKVDYVSSAGSSPPETIRGGHCHQVITPKAVFGFDKVAGILRLQSIHSPHTLDDIRANTGFDLGVGGPVPATVPPTADELRVLREVVRPKMIETGTYASFAEKTLGAPSAPA
jgi:glutaconate CoA-transferase subunit B